MTQKFYEEARTELKFDLSYFGKVAAAAAFFQLISFGDRRLNFYFLRMAAKKSTGNNSDKQSSIQVEVETDT